MSLSYNKANTLFRENKIRELASTTDGLKFLKLRSLSRKEHWKGKDYKTESDIIFVIKES